MSDSTYQPPGSDKPTATDLNNLHKSVYEDNIEKIMPASTKFLRLIPYKGKKEEGGKITQPVQVSEEHGFSSGEGPYRLNGAVPAQWEVSEFESTEIILKTVISYKQATKAKGGQASYVTWGGIYPVAMMNSMSRRLEHLMFYGKKGIGEVESKKGITFKGQSAVEIVITKASWAPGPWIGGETMLLDSFNGENKVNGGPLQVKSIKISKRTIVLANADEDDSTDHAAKVAKGQKLFHYKMRKWEFAGMQAYLENRSVLYNIDANIHHMWQGNTLSCKGVEFSDAVIDRAVDMIVDHGFEDEELHCFVSTSAWSKLHANFKTKRFIDASYSSEIGEDGVKKIRYVSQNGVIHIHSSNFIRRSHAFIFPKSKVFRKGGSDITFKSPGNGQDLYVELQENAGFQLRLYSMQALFISRPSFCCFIHDIDPDFNADPAKPLVTPEAGVVTPVGQDGADPAGTETGGG